MRGAATLRTGMAAKTTPARTDPSNTGMMVPPRRQAWVGVRKPRATKQTKARRRPITVPRELGRVPHRRRAASAPTSIAIMQTAKMFPVMSPSRTVQLRVWRAYATDFSGSSLADVLLSTATMSPMLPKRQPAMPINRTSALALVSAKTHSSVMSPSSTFSLAGSTRRPGYRSRTRSTPLPLYSPCGGTSKGMSAQRPPNTNSATNARPSATPTPGFSGGEPGTAVRPHDPPRPTKNRSEPRSRPAA